MFRFFVVLAVVAVAAGFSLKLNKIAGAVAGFGVALAPLAPAFADGAVSASTIFRARNTYGAKIQDLAPAVEKGDFAAFDNKKVLNAFDLFISGTNKRVTDKPTLKKEKEIEEAIFKAVKAKDSAGLKKAYAEFINFADLTKEYKVRVCMCFHPTTPLLTSSISPLSLPRSRTSSGRRTPAATPPPGAPLANTSTSGKFIPPRPAVQSSLKETVPCRGCSTRNYINPNCQRNSLPHAQTETVNRSEPYYSTTGSGVGRIFRLGAASCACRSRPCARTVKVRHCWCTEDTFGTSLFPPARFNLENAR